MTTPVPNGVLVIDKPAGWTSHDVVGRVRRLAGTRKVGHAGTLDPMATGVLLVGVGPATRLLTFMVGCDKEYTATIRLGQATVTDDAEGEVTEQPGAADVTDAAIARQLRELTGELQQVPSAVSAIKVDGRRAYARVRGGEQVRLAPRPVRVDRFELVSARRDGRGGSAVVDLDVVVTVSAGTYVRALARDLGVALGTGGHLRALRRTRVGGFGVQHSHALDRLSAPLPLLSPARAADTVMPSRRLTDAEARAVGFGQPIASQLPGRPEPVAAVGPDGSLLAVLDETAPTARYHAVLATPEATGTGPR